MKRYLDMLREGRRVEAFRRAVAALAPGRVVADLGCGFGTYAVAALRAGARAVYAVDADPVIEEAMAAARASGAGAITFLRGRSELIEPPERVDVALFEDLELLVSGPEIQDVVRDIHARWLAPGGFMIPAEAEVLLAPCRADTFVTAEMEARAVAAAGALEISGAVRRARHEVHSVNATPAWLLGPPRAVARLSFAPGGELAVDARAELAVAEGGRCDGLLAWFRLHLAPGIAYEGDPASGWNAWGQALLPLQEPFEVRSGDELAVLLQGGGALPVWRWRVRLGDRVQEMTTFDAAPRARSDLVRSGDAAATAARAAALRHVLELVPDGSAPPRALAGVLARRFPEAFAAPDDAIRFVRGVTEVLVK